MRSYGDTRLCVHGSCILGKVQRATLEEPAAVILHGGICEGGDVRGATVDLHAHEAGNGG